MTNINIIIDKIDNGVGLDTVFVRSFDDEYHQQTIDVDDELLMEARKIRRRYRSFADFYHAQAVFAEYMERLMEEYGGREKLLMFLAHDAVQEFVPPIPRMRNTKQNRSIMELGIPVSTYTGSSMKIDQNSMDELLDEYESIDGAAYIVMGENKPSEESDDMYYKADMVTGISNRPSELSTLSILEREINNTVRNKGITNAVSEFDRPIDATLDEIVTGEYIEWLDEIDKNKNTLTYRSTPVTKEQYDTLKLSEILSKGGWNGNKIINNMKRSAGVDVERDRTTRLAKEAAKHERRMKKRERKRLKQQQAQSSFAQDVFGYDADSYLSFEDNLFTF